MDNSRLIPNRSFPLPTLQPRRLPRQFPGLNPLPEPPSAPPLSGARWIKRSISKRNPIKPSSGSKTKLGFPTTTKRPGTRAEAAVVLAPVFLVGSNQFLTNAHVVSNSRLLYIKKIDDPTPYEAEIVHIAHDCDLALLQLKDPSAFKNVQPLDFGTIPPLDSTVIVVGYPIGGQRISVTRGVVSPG